MHKLYRTVFLLATFSVVQALLSGCATLESGKTPAADQAKDGAIDTDKAQEALQQDWERYPQVGVNTSLQGVQFQDLDLRNTRKEIEGKLYYAFRFSAPEKCGQLVWAFTLVEGLESWYVIPAQGGMHGFEFFNVQQVEQRDLATNSSREISMVLQQLQGSSFVPGAEYIMWFIFQEGADARLGVSLNMLPEMLIPSSVDNCSIEEFAKVFPELF